MLGAQARSWYQLPVADARSDVVGDAPVGELPVLASRRGKITHMTTVASADLHKLTGKLYEIFIRALQ